MKVIVTIKSFDDNMEQYDFLIPTIVESMDKLIHDLISLEKPIINVDGLNAVHFTDNYREELFAFQETIGHPSFATRNKIADGYAQVVLVEEGKGMPVLASGEKGQNKSENMGHLSSD